jgi:hypoxanthine phosphoribosyltransferase
VLLHYRSLHDLTSDIAKNIHKVQQQDFDLIVGIPRSGMIPAYTIALYLNVNVTDVDGLIHNHLLQKGKTRSPKHNIVAPQDAKRILLVDDSIFTGTSLVELVESFEPSLREKITTCAIYSTHKKRDDIDIYFEYVPNPRAFEWNIFHRDILRTSAVSVEGVLCTQEDSTVLEGESYTHHLSHTRPNMLPTYTINTLVSNKSSAYKEELSSWLDKHNIQYNNLVMLDVPASESVDHKARLYKENKELTMFFEYDERDAFELYKKTKKFVYLVSKRQLIKPNSLEMILHNKVALKGIRKKRTR